MTAPNSRSGISVAMATYNGEKYIQEQLDSIAGQELLPLELVITDDGSTDATLQIVDDFARTAPFPVRVFRNETRLGYAENFLKAASLCNGDQIAFCDQDDIWMEKKLKVCSGFFADPEVLLVAHSARTLLDSGERGHVFPRFKRTVVLHPGAANPFSFVHGFAVIAAKELLIVPRVHDCPARISGHDQWVWFLAASMGKIARIADVLALYRQHEENLFGASAQITMLSSVRGAVQNVSYAAAADSEIACSRILLSAAEQCPERASRLNSSAKKLKFIGRLHSLRDRIYSEDSNLLRRVWAFLVISALAGYLPNSSGARLGLRAGIKDLVLGIPRAYRLLPFNFRSSVKAN